MMLHLLSEPAASHGANIRKRATPTLTEPLHLVTRLGQTERAGSASKGKHMAQTTTIRELAHRVADGVEISLLWNEIDGSLRVVVVDARRRLDLARRGCLGAP